VADVEIGIGKSGRRAYGFDDIAIVPSRRTRDPEDVDISWEIDAFRFDLPVLAAAMDGVVSPATAIEIGRLGGLGVLNLEGLWTSLGDGWLQMVVSDHSPSTLELKQGDNFLRIWGGISGCQSTRQLLLAQNRLDLQAIAALTSTNVAKRFGLTRKGDVAPGFDADLWLGDLSKEDVVRRDDLLYRNPFSAHEGQRIRGRTVRTLVRGQTVFSDGRVVPGPAGRQVTRAR